MSSVDQFDGVGSQERQVAVERGEATPARSSRDRESSITSIDGHGESHQISPGPTSPAELRLHQKLPMSRAFERKHLRSFAHIPW